MVSIARRPNGQWRPRYRDAAGKEHARHFDKKADAQAWLDSVTTSVLTGAYVDPKRTRVTVAEWAGQWLDSKVDLKPTTHRCYEVSLRVHILPTWGPLRLGDITHQGIAACIRRHRGRPQSCHGMCTTSRGDRLRAATQRCSRPAGQERRSVRPTREDTR